MQPCISNSAFEELLAGGLNQEESTRVQMHCETCPECQLRLDRMRADDALFRDLQQVMQPLRETPSEVESKDFAATLREHGYELKSEIHRGGQGIVFRAFHDSTHREVAVKQLTYKPWTSTEQRIRFEREVEVIARLSHPHIVTVFDSGVAADCPYFVMELVDGRTLDDYFSFQQSCPKTDIEIRDRLRLFRKICSAVSQAHRQGVVHRDLKPSNVVVDSSGAPKVLDFGLAKISENQPEQGLTQSGQFLGTLAYASPEQVGIRPDRLDVRTDVYSLGVMLYELLTHHMPYAIDLGLTATVDNIVNQVPTALSVSNRIIDKDLDIIAQKALAKDVERRYQSVDLLDRDLELYLDDRPIEARRDSNLYILRKTLRKHKRFVGGLAMLVSAICVALVVSLFFWNDAIDQRDVARAASDVAREAQQEAEFQSYVANIGAAKGAVLNYDAAEAKRRLQHAPLAFSNWEREYWLRRSDDSLRTIVQHDLYIHTCSIFPDGQRVVSIAGDNQLRVWSLESSQPDRALSLNVQGHLTAVNQDGSWIACVAEGTRVQVFDATNLVMLFDHESEFYVKDIEFLANNQLAFCGLDPTQGKGSIALWDPVSQESQTWQETHDVWALAAHPNEPIVAFAADRLGLLDTRQPGAITQLGEDGYFQDVKFDAQGDRLAASRFREVDIFDLESSQRVTRLKGHTMSVSGVCFVPGSDFVLTCSNDRTIRTWHAETGAQVALQIGHDQIVNSIECVADSGQALTASKDGSFKLWNVEPVENPRRLVYQSGIVRDIDFSPDSQFVATASEDGSVVVRHCDSGELIEILDHDRPVFAVEYHPEGSHIATAGDEFRIRLWDLEARKVEKFEGHSDRVHSLDFDDHGDRLLSGSRDGTVRIWDLDSKSPITVFDGHQECVHNAVFDRSGSYVASRSHHDCRLWNASSLDEVFLQKQRMGPEDYSLAFDPKDGRLAVGSSIEGFGRGFVNLVDQTTGKVAMTLEQHNAPIRDFDFKPDGTRAVSASVDAIKVWDIQRGEEVASLDGIESDVFCVKFSPDGTKIAAGLADGSILIWDSN